MKKKFLSLFDVIRSVTRIAGAIDTKRSPQASDLKTLGIDPTQYNKIRRV